MFSQRRSGRLAGNGCRSWCRSPVPFIGAARVAAQRFPVHAAMDGDRPLTGRGYQHGRLQQGLAVIVKNQKPGLSSTATKDNQLAPVDRGYVGDGGVGHEHGLGFSGEVERDSGIRLDPYGAFSPGGRSRNGPCGQDTENREGENLNHPLSFRHYDRAANRMRSRVKLTTYLIKKFFGYDAPAALGIAALGIAGLLLTGCQGVPVDRKLDGYIMSSAKGAEANHDYGAAAAQFASVYDAAHPNADVAIGMARNLRYAGKGAEAVGALENSLRQLGDRPDLLIELGKQHVAAGKPELAVDPLLRAARLAPSQWEAAHVLGIAYDRMGRHDEARTSYERASALSPGNARILNNLALSRAMAGDLETAVQLLERATALPSAPAQVQANLQLIAQLKSAEPAGAVK
jgi:Flp pilus assembly protein TadD